VSGTERRSSDRTLDDPVGGDVIRAPVGSGDDDDGGDVDCVTSWNDDDEDSDCSDSISSSSGDGVARQSGPGAERPRTMTAHLENVVVVRARDDHDGDDAPRWTSPSPPLPSTRPRGDWPGSSRRSTSSLAPTPRGAVRTHAPPYRVDRRPTTPAWRRAARATQLPTAAVRRRPAGATASGGSSLGLNIGLIVGIAAGVVVLFLVLGYAVNRYRRCRGGADCGTYRLDRATVGGGGGGEACCRYNGLHLAASQPPPPPLGLQSAPRGCYATSTAALGKPGACKLPSKEWYV